MCLYIPTEVLMNEFNGRLTDSGQVVTDQIISILQDQGWVDSELQRSMGSIDCEVGRRTGRPHWTNTVFYRCDQGVPAAIGQAMPECGRTALR